MISLDGNGHYDGNLVLRGYAHPLPAGLVSVGGNLYLTRYDHPLPTGLVSVGGYLDLRGYAHPLPAGFASVGGSLCLGGYAHPLPAGLVAQAPLVEDLDWKILDAIERGGKLNMCTWHTCTTTHCRAGWAICCAGEAGAELERKHGPEGAGALLYERSTGRRPDFFASNEEALADIRRCAGL